MKTKSNIKWVWIPVSLATLVVLILFAYYMIFYSNLGKSFMGTKPACSSDSDMEILFVGIDYR
jgi:hypothetical protein